MAVRILMAVQAATVRRRRRAPWIGAVASCALVGCGPIIGESRIEPPDFQSCWSADSDREVTLAADRYCAAFGRIAVRGMPTGYWPCMAQHTELRITFFCVPPKGRDPDDFSATPA